MDSNFFNNTRVSVKVVGLLFLITMTFSILGNLTIAGLVSEEAYLPIVHDEGFIFALAALSMFFNSLGVLGIGVFVYPILRSINESVALIYLVTRIFEGVLLTVGVISLLTLIGLGQEALELSDSTSTDFYVLGKVAIKTNWYAYNFSMAALGLGSLPFCFLLFRFRIVPPMLSVLGLIGYSVLVISSVTAVLGMDLGLMVTIPVFFFEVILGVWLVWKGMELKINKLDY